MKTTSPMHVAVSAVLIERGYTQRECDYGLGNFKSGEISKLLVRDYANHAQYNIDLLRDNGRVGTIAYEGLAYFWAYKYRFWMRGDAHGNGYDKLPIEQARRIIHKRMMDAGIELNGESAAHDEIVNDVFDMNEYSQEKKVA